MLSSYLAKKDLIVFDFVARRINSIALKRRRISLIKSFSYFKNLTDLDGVASIMFKDGRSTLELSDGRMYYFNPLAADASGLFSLPVTGEFEKKETDVIRKLVNSEDICIDVGANFGYYTVLMAKYGKEVHAFEPLTHTCKILQENISLNECCNVITNELALDKTESEKEIFLPDIGISGSFKLHRYKKSFKKFVIRTVSLDKYAADLDLTSIDFIKADIEGAELLMLEGGSSVLAKFKPILFLEVQKSSTQLFGYFPSDLFKYLEQFGYEAFYAKKGGLVRLESYEDLPDYNFFFLPEGKKGSVLSKLDKK